MLNILAWVGGEEKACRGDVDKEKLNGAYFFFFFTLTNLFR